jgi:uncharacterized protein (DUF58 family)
MIIPRKIIFISALVAPPALAAAFMPGLGYPLLAAVALLIVVSIVDLTLCLGYRNKIMVTVPEITRCSQLCDSKISFIIENTIESPLIIENFSHCLPLRLQAETAPSQLSLPPGAREKLEVPCCPERRGIYHFAPCLFEAVSPLGLWSFRGKIKLSGEIRVFPDLFTEQKKMAAIFLQRGILGSHIMRFAGQGRDFERLRDYVPGDNYDTIAWKATARRAKPVSKVYQIENTQNIYAVIDASRFSTIEKNSKSNFDFYLASALVLGAAAERYGDAFGIVIFDSKVRSFIPAMTGGAAAKSCRNAVFSVQPQAEPPDFNSLFSFIRNRIPRRSMMFFLSDISNAVPAEEFIRDIELVSRKHLCLVNMLNHEGIEPMFNREFDHIEDVYRGLAGHLKWTELENRAMELRRHGVGFNTSTKEQLSIDLINSYLQIKRRQLL